MKIIKIFLYNATKKEIFAQCDRNRNSVKKVAAFAFLQRTLVEQREEKTQGFLQIGEGAY